MPLKPDQRLTFRLFLPVAYLRVPILIWNIVNGINKIAAHVVLESLNNSVAPAFIKPLIYILSQLHYLLAFLLYKNVPQHNMEVFIISLVIFTFIVCLPVSNQFQIALECATIHLYLFHNIIS